MKGGEHYAQPDCTLPRANNPFSTPPGTVIRRGRRSIALSRDRMKFHRRKTCLPGREASTVITVAAKARENRRHCHSCYICVEDLNPDIISRDVDEIHPQEDVHGRAGAPQYTMKNGTCFIQTKKRK